MHFVVVVFVVVVGVVDDDNDGDNNVTHRPPNGDIENAMALVWRDTTCSFLDKTMLAQELGSSAAIHVNTEEELMQVEAKNAGKEDAVVWRLSMFAGLLSKKKKASRTKCKGPSLAPYVWNFCQ